MARSGNKGRSSKNNRRSNGRHTGPGPSNNKKDNTPRVHWGTGDIGGPRHEYRESLLMGLIKDDLRSGQLVLDAGCGSGSLLLKLAGQGCAVHGVEQSEEFVGMLRRRVKTNAASGIVQVKYGSVDAIPYPDMSFDVVVSGDVLEHVKNDDGAVSEFYRVLKPGGACVISVPASPSLWDMTDDWAGHLRRYTKKGIVSLFEKNGFVVEDVGFWGFPLVSLYHRFLYLPHIRKKRSAGAEGKASHDAISPPDAGKHQVASRAFNMIFRIDSLFRWLPFGIGLLLRARKQDKGSGVLEAKM